MSTLNLVRMTSIQQFSELPIWLDRVAYPFSPKRFRTGDGELSYLDEGTGPTVLLVHGTPSWSFEFRMVIKELSRTHRCVVVDHLGFGLSDKPRSAPLTPVAHASRLRELVRELGLRDVTLVLHDFGGPIGLPLALDEDAAVTRVILINTWMWSSAEERELIWLDRLVRSPIGRLLYLWLNFSVRILMPSLFSDRKQLSKAVHRQYIAPLGSRTEREGTYAMALALKGAGPYYDELWEKRSALARLPLTIIWGMQDRALGEPYFEKWKEHFPKAKIVRLEECGHFVAEERPDIVVDAVRG